MGDDIAARLQEIADEMCNDYCKWAECAHGCETDEELERYMAERCDKCPLLRLI